MDEEPELFNILNSDMSVVEDRHIIGTRKRPGFYVGLGDLS